MTKEQMINEIAMAEAEMLYDGGTDDISEMLIHGYTGLNTLSTEELKELYDDMFG